MNADDNRLDAYLEGALPPAEVEAVEERLRADPEWRLALLMEAGLSARLRAVLQHEAAPALVLRPAAGRRLWIPLAAAAAVLALAGAALWVSRPSAPAPGSPAVAAPSTGGRGILAQSPKVAPDAHPPTVGTDGKVATSKGPEIAPESSAPSPAPAPVAGGVVAADGSRRTGLEAAAAAMPIPAPPVVPPRGGIVVAADNPRRVAGGAEPAGAAVAGRMPRVPAGPPPGGRVLAVSGTVMFRAGGDGQAAGAADRLQAGDGLAQGDTIQTGPQSAATLRYTDGSMLRLRGDTQLTLARMGSDRAVDLAAGGLDLQVQAPGSHARFLVRTPFVSARVASHPVSTGFRVLTDSDSSWVGVWTGAVEVVRVALPAGERASAGTPVTPVVNLQAWECAAVVPGHAFERLPWSVWSGAAGAKP